MSRLIALIVLILSPLVSTGADFKVGDIVFVRPDAEATMGDEKVEANTIPIPCEIAQIKGKKVLLTDAHRSTKTDQAWVRKSDLMRIDEALSYFSEEIVKNPKNPQLWLKRGLVCREKHEPNDAIRDFTEAIKLDPQFTEAYMKRALICRGFVIERKLDTSFDDFSEVIRLAPNDPSAYSWRAYCWDEKGDIDNAIEDYTTAIRLVDTEGSTFFYRGYYRQEKGDFDGAVKDYVEALRLDQTRADFYNGIAWLQATCPDDRYRDGKAAVEYSIKACALTEWRNFAYLDTLAAAYAESGDFTNAFKYAEKSFKVASEGEKEDARKRLELYRANKPYRDPSIYSDVAWRRATSPVDGYRDGKIAIEFATKACVLTEWQQSRPLNVLAAAYAESGDFSKAIEFGEKALKVAPEKGKQELNERLDLYRLNKPFRDGSHTRYLDNLNE